MNPDPTADFHALDAALDHDGPGALLDLLAETLIQRRAYRDLFDALLLKARHDLGLPLIPAEGPVDWPEATRRAYEDRYVEALTSVGRRLLDEGKIAAAWPYFRTAGEKAPVVEAIEAYRPEPGDPSARLDPILDVALYQGVHPVKGFTLILEHYGACPAITAFDQLPPDEPTRAVCAERLVGHLHEQLSAVLRAEVGRHDGVEPVSESSLTRLLDGRPWLFDDDAYHLDVSHLAATVRASPLLKDPKAIDQAIDLAEYGSRLSPRHQYDGEPPFDNLYRDHLRYLKALAGEGVEATLEHFRGRLGPVDPEPHPGSTLPAQVLVNLLSRMGQLDEAIEVASTHLRGLPDAALACPGVAQLCRRAGRLDQLAGIARDGGDLVHYAAAVVQSNAEAEPVVSGS